MKFVSGTSRAHRSLRHPSIVAAIRTALCLASVVPLAFSAGALAQSSVEASTKVRYTIVLKGEPLAAHGGALRIASGQRAGRLDVNAASSREYVAELAQRQDAFLQSASVSLARPLTAIAKMQHALNAVVVELDAGEAAAIAQRPDVEFVDAERELELLTDRGPAFIGAPWIWDGSGSHGLASMGEGTVAAVLDTGINWQSPAFAAVGPIDGYVHVNPNGAGNYVGLCGPTPPNADSGRCNDKLIGMYDFTSTSTSRSATDLNGHGSHTASTVGGNTWDAPFGGGTFRISGVAPHANIVAFRVCTSGCSSSASSQAVNQAVALGYVDSLNYSISGGTSPWSDSVATAFRNAVGAGMFIAASAGNDGPVAGSVNHLEPWVETVAASTKDNVVGFRFDVTGPGTPPPDTQGLPLRPAAPPLPTASLVDVPIVRSPNFSNGSNDGCEAYAANAFTVPDGAGGHLGAVAVLALDQNASNCGSGARRTAALNAGAIGVVFVDRDFINLGASDTSWSMLRADWDKAWAAMQAAPDLARASLLLPAESFVQRGDVVSDYSSRGPRANSGQFLAKPNITAPGTDILAAYMAGAGGATATALSNGTSMSSPHIAGSALLLRAVQPDWTPTEIRSAMNMTAFTENLVRADGSPVGAWDLGSGRIDLTRAALSGLVLDETTANFVAANPASGGVLANLNLAEFTSANCATTCTFSRTLRSTSEAAQSYLATVGGPFASAVTVTPAEFTIEAGATQVIEVTVDGATLSTGWNFGQLLLAPQELPPEEDTDTVFKDGFDGAQEVPEPELGPTLRLPISIRR